MGLPTWISHHHCLTELHHDQHPRGVTLTSGPAAPPSLPAFAKPGHVLYGSDWPFAPELAVGYFSTWTDGAHIDHHSAHSLITRLKETPDV